MSLTSNPSLTVIFRDANNYPVVTTICSDADIYDLIGYGAIRVTQVDDDVLAISRADAYDNDEPVTITHSYSEDDVLCIRHIYGDVIIVGYDPENDEAVSLNSYQLSRWLFTPEDLE